MMAGCGYPTITPDAYEVAKALHTGINLRDDATLTKAEEYVRTAHTEGRLADQERELFERAIGLARDGEWDAAQEELHALLAAQNEEE